MMLGDKSEENERQTLESIDKAIEIEEELQKAKVNKNSVLGRYYYCAATIYQG